MTAPTADDRVADDGGQPVVGGPPRGRTARSVAIGVGVVVLGLVALFAVGSDRGDETATSALLGNRVPAVVGSTLDGGTYDIDDARGRWVLVNFFATWCPGCIVEHPELIAFHDWGQETGRAEVVAVVFNDPPEAVARFFDENGGDWPVLDEPSVPVAFQVSRIPESFLVAPSGQVVQHVQGEVSARELVSFIEAAEAEAGGSGGSGGDGVDG